MSKERPRRATLERELAEEVVALQDATDGVDEAASLVLGLNRTDMRCLGLLARGGPTTAGGLAEAAHLSPGAMTTVLDRLERAGYARRISDAGDRRRVLVEMTPEAQRRAELLYGPIAREGVSSLRGYTDAELEAILRFVRASRELQDRYAARIREQTSSLRSSLAGAKIAAKQTKGELKAVAQDVKYAAKDVKAEVKAALKGRRRR